MSGKLIYIWHADGSPFLGRRSNNAATEGNPNTRQFALERSKHQFAALEQIKACPVQFRNGMKNQCRSIRHVRDGVRFVFDYSGNLGCELHI